MTKPHYVSSLHSRFHWEKIAIQIWVTQYIIESDKPSFIGTYPYSTMYITTCDPSAMTRYSGTCSSVDFWNPVLIFAMWLVAPLSIRHLNRVAYISVGLSDAECGIYTTVIISGTHLAWWGFWFERHPCPQPLLIHLPILLIPGTLSEIVIHLTTCVTPLRVTVVSSIAIVSWQEGGVRIGLVSVTTGDTGRSRWTLPPLPSVTHC